MQDRVRPDTFKQLNVEGSEQPLIVNAKYDRMDHFPAFGAWILKVYDDEVGLVSCHLDEATARQVVEFTEIPIVERDFMYESEHEAHLQGQERMLEQYWLDPPTL